VSNIVGVRVPPSAPINPCFALKSLSFFPKITARRQFGSVQPNVAVWGARSPGAGGGEACSWPPQHSSAVSCWSRDRVSQRNAATAIPVLVVIASPCRFSKSRGDSLTSDNAPQVARAQLDRSLISPISLKVFQAPRAFSESSAAITYASSRQRHLIAGVISRSKDPKEG
jgi:hypothetical protein